jgi:hypothetical protein
MTNDSFLDDYISYIRSNFKIIKMKKLFVYGLGVLFIAGSATSCGKSSKGKMDNSWTVTNWEQTETSTNEDGDVTVTKTTSDGTIITMVETDTPNGGSPDVTTTNGTVQKLTYVIAKDGTFTQEIDVTFTSTFTGGSVSQNVKNTIEGKWDFLKGVGEFKKNERVVFSTTKETSVSTQVITIGGTAGTPSVSTNTSEYADGENTQIFVIVESKGKELQLKSETNAKYTDSNGTETEVGELMITLSQAD